MCQAMRVSPERIQLTSPPIRSSPLSFCAEKIFTVYPKSREQEGGGSRAAHVWPRVSTQWTSGETVTLQLSLSSTHSNLSPTARTSASGMPTISRRTYLHDLQGVVGDTAVEKQSQCERVREQEWASTQGQQKQEIKEICWKMCCDSHLHRSQSQFSASRGQKEKSSRVQGDGGRVENWGVGYGGVHFGR